MHGLFFYFLGQDLWKLTKRALRSKGFVFYFIASFGVAVFIVIPPMAQLVVAGVILHKMLDPKWVIKGNTRHLYHHHLYHKKRRPDRANQKA